jgi:TDG/mug DNA glycosylase family protein
VDARTAAVYEASAREWIARRTPRAIEDGRLDAFARALPEGACVADLGCGPGWYAAALRERGYRAIALDASAAMLAEARRRAPALPVVRADLAALPFARQTLDGAWAINAYVHLAPAELPAAFARLQAALRPGAPLHLTLPDLAAARPDAPEACDELEHRLEDDEFAGRLFGLVRERRARALLEGAGFDVVAIGRARRGFWLALTATRARALPDRVRRGLRLLVCGLNPSLYAADAGVPYARPGNRFWPAAVRAGLVERERDVLGALVHGVGFTDCVRRATARASELSPREYALGLARVEDLVRRFEPAAVVFVGLAGWRAAVDRRAAPGWIAGGFGSRPAYLMPSTSGLNARTSLDALAGHLATAASPPSDQTRTSGTASPA